MTVWRHSVPVRCADSGYAANAMHRKGYHPPPVRRVWIPKPGKVAKRRPIAPEA